MSSHAERLETLAPVFAERCRQVEARAQAAGVRVRWSQTLRSLDDQRKLYALGRDQYWNIIEPAKVVTHARPGWSWHEFGCAADFAILKGETAVEWSPVADLDLDGLVDWLEVGRIAEEVGLDWGGRWGKPDLPHLEYHPGLTIIDARRLMLANPSQSLRAIWAAISVTHHP